MKCPECESTHITFLGVWYVERGDVHILMSHYGCLNCRTAFVRPVDDKVYYYVKEVHTDVMLRPTHAPNAHERRLPIVNMAPGVLI